MIEHHIQEPLGAAWRDELICLPYTGRSPVRVVGCERAEELPSQISGDSLWVRISLQPHERLRLRIEPLKATTANPFRITSHESRITISNGCVGVVIPASGTSDAGDAPGPIQSFEHDGRRIGHGAWGPFASAGQIETEILDRGPLFARWTTRYLAAGRELARYECRLVAGEDFIHVRDVTAPDAGAAFRFRLADADAPTHWFTHGGGEAVTVLCRPMSERPDQKGQQREGEFIHIDFSSGHFQMSYTWAGFFREGGRAVGACELNGGHWQVPGRNRIRVCSTAFRRNLIEGQLSIPPEGGTTNAPITHTTAKPPTHEPPVLGRQCKGQNGSGGFHLDPLPRSGREEMSRLQRGPELRTPLPRSGEGGAGRPSETAFHIPSPLGGEKAAGRPSETTSRIPSPLGGEKAAGRSSETASHIPSPLGGEGRVRGGAVDIELVFPADGGSKEFALVCGATQELAPAKGLSRFCHLRRKYSDIPLEKVRHWVLDWPQPKRDRPILYPRGTVENWREKLKSWPTLEAAYRERDLKVQPALLVKYLGTNDSALLSRLVQQIDEMLAKSVNYVLHNGYLRLNIFNGRILKVALEAIDVLRWRGELDDATERSFARRAAFLAYCFADNAFWPWDSAFRDRTDPASLGEEYATDIGDSICPPNFWTEYYTSFGLVGLTYPEHPAAKEWVARSVDLFERNLAFWFYDSGAYAESVNYHAHELSMLTHFAVGLLAGGHRDFFEHPRFKANYGFFLESLTPPIAMTPAARELAKAPDCLNPPKDDRVVLLTNWGNSGHDCSGFLVPVTLAIAAGIYAERDVDYARRLMTAWRISPQEFCTGYLALHLVALGRPDLPDVELNLGSKLVEGLGATMRAGDVFGWIKCSTATHHNCRDEGGLVLYAHGAPVIGDFGYHVEIKGRREGVTETWKHTCVSFGGRTTSAYLGTEITMPPESWRSTSEADLLVCYLPVENIIREGMPYLNVERVSRIEHRRFILFVKPRYFVIYDHIPQTSLPSTWWVHAMADSTEVGTQNARFHGRYGVDLDVQVLLPTPAKIAEGVYAMQRHIRIDEPGAGDYLTVLTPLRKGERSPQASYAPLHQLLEVRGEWGVDRIGVRPDANLEEVLFLRAGAATKS